MSSYNEWFEKHAKKHQKIMLKLQDLLDDEIIDYFDYENMRVKEVDFCPLYAQNKKCHDMDELNCYLCACPNFRFDDNGIRKQEDKILYSFCSFDSKYGEQFIGKDSIHQNCSNCRIPHRKRYIKKVFSRNWKEIMSEVRQEK